MGIPQNLGIALKKAAIDDDFRKDLLLRRSKAVNDLGLKLDPAEMIMLDSCPNGQLKAMIDGTWVTPRESRLLGGGCLTAGVVGLITMGLSIMGPMMSSIGGNRPGDASWVKNKLAGLRSALLTMNADIGRFPHLERELTPENVNRSDNLLLGTTFETNILVNPRVSGEGVASPPMGGQNFDRRWKGPYMVDSPEEFMTDGKGNKIRYVWYNHAIWLQAPGPDGIYAPLEQATNPAYNSGPGGPDDYLLMVVRLKKR